MRCAQSTVGLLAFCLVLVDTTSALSINRPARSLSYTDLGCYTDNADGKRALTGKSTAADDMSVQKCATFCSQYELFSVEYGRERYCGNSRDTGSIKANEGDCSFSCAANPEGAEKCGAGDRLNLYSNLNIVTVKPATLHGITSLGCFVDNGSRVLPKGITSSQDMTAAKCALNCVGYKYFGTQYSSECYCGITAPATPAPASECNMACTGNSDELCGGSMRLNVYKVDAPSTSTAISSSAPALPTPSTPFVTISGYEYQGCYTDNIPQRALSGKTMADPAMTLEKCALFCRNGGYSWFGVEYSSECYCGTVLDTLSVQSRESACDAKCSGDASQNCGSANLLNAYKDPSLTVPTQPSSDSLNGFKYMSCWTDNVNDRSLKSVEYHTDDMTVEKCSERCKDYAYFGLEYGSECYCGAAISGQAAPAAECGMLCVGAAGQWCGGPDRLNVYTKVLALDSSSAATSSENAVSSSVASIAPDSTSFKLPAASVSSETFLYNSSAASTALDLLSSSTSSAVTYTQTKPSSSAALSTSVSATFTSSDATVPITSLIASASVSATTSEVNDSTISSDGAGLSSFAPLATSVTITSWSRPTAALTTITSCPATPTYAGIPEYCLASFPNNCAAMTTYSQAWTSMPLYVSLCRNQITVSGANVAVPATTCFPSVPSDYVASDKAAVSSTMSSIVSCLQVPSNSLMCQYDSTCATQTFIIGQQPSAAPGSGIGTELFQDGSFEDGTIGGWKQLIDGQNTTNFNPGLSREKSNSGNYGIGVKFDNNNGAEVTWERYVKIIPGKKYQLQAYYLMDIKTANARCDFKVGASQSGSSTLQVRKSNVATNWRKTAWTMQSRSSLDRFFVSITCYPDYGGANSNIIAEIWTDDWTLTQMS